MSTVAVWSCITLALLAGAFICDEVCARGFGRTWAWMSYAFLTSAFLATLVTIELAL